MILDRLDYLKELGVDLIWLSPVYQSPFVDQGYDISDYYGSRKNSGPWKTLIFWWRKRRRRGMGIVMDLVVNHCSDRHEWFQKALADPEGEYGDYFYFRKGKRRQGAQQLPVLFRRQRLGAGAGYRLLLFPRILPRSSRILTGRIRWCGRRSMRW